jgi:hypothetical protein
MGHNMAYWKILEEMTIELKKKSVVIPENILGDLRSAKSMIKLHCTQAIGAGDVIQKAEELTANVEAYLVTEGQKLLGSEKIDLWLRRLEEANAEVCEEATAENKFVTGVPRDQKWVRVEPVNSLSTERMGQIACTLGLEIKPQKDGKLVVYGQQDNIKDFIKKMTTEAKNNLK